MHEVSAQSNEQDNPRHEDAEGNKEMTVGKDGLKCAQSKQAPGCRAGLRNR